MARRSRRYGNGRAASRCACRSAATRPASSASSSTSTRCRAAVAPPARPAGTTGGSLFGAAYSGWGFQSTRLEDGRSGSTTTRSRPPGRARADKDAAYAGTVTGDLALDFIRAHRDDDAPYFLEVAPYAPHSRINPGRPTPATRCSRRRSGTGRGRARRTATAAGSAATGSVSTACRATATTRPTTPRGTPTGVRRRRGTRPPPGRAGRDAATSLRNRARMVQSIDRTVRRILREVGPDTYVVLTSDNGFHLGQHGLGKGKGTPYDSDVHVPLLVTGPGVVPGLAHGGGEQHRPRADLRGPRRAGGRRRTAPARRWCRPSATPGWTAAATRSSSTPGRRRSASTRTAPTPAARWT